MQVLLQPSKDVLTQRVQQRAAEGTHFMPASLLESQLALMEVDSSAYRYGETQQASLSASCNVGLCPNTSSCLDACDRWGHKPTVAIVKAWTQGLVLSP